MRRRHSDNPTSGQFVADWEQRVAKQEQLIEALKRRGSPTAEAQAELRQQQQTLAALRNHADIMQSLMSPNAPDKKSAV